MLTISRSPLNSPSLRTIASASSYISTPSSPLSRPSHSTISHIRLPSMVQSPRDHHSSSPGTPVHESYFNLVGTSSSPCRLSVACSPACGFPSSPIVMPVSSLLSHGNATSSAVEQLAIGHLAMSSPSSHATSVDSASSATAKSAEPQARLKPSFTLAFPRQTLSRDNSFDCMRFTDSAFSPVRPGELTWSDSFDSVMTLKPIRGRVPTPYPKMDAEGEWIQDVEEAIRMM